MKAERRPRKPTMRLPWGIALVLSVLLSGVPHALASVANDGEAACQVMCPGADEEQTCAPLCGQGACAKVAPATSTPAPMSDMSPPVVDGGTLALPANQLVPLAAVEDGVFHPPRA